MRVVGGNFRGRPLHAPDGKSIRPTSDRVREALFNILTHTALGPGWPGLPGARVLDVFAGSGALGIEALSRGAASVEFIENSTDARLYLNRNLAGLGLTDRTNVHAFDATQPPPGRRQASLALLDPPYHSGLGFHALPALAEKGWLADGAIAILEEAEPSAPDLPSFTLLQTRTYRRTALLFWRWADPGTTRRDPALQHDR